MPLKKCGQGVGRNPRFVLKMRIKKAERPKTSLLYNLKPQGKAAEPAVYFPEFRGIN